MPEFKKQRPGVRETLDARPAESKSSLCDEPTHYSAGCARLVALNGGIGSAHVPQTHEATPMSPATALSGLIHPLTLKLMKLATSGRRLRCS